MSAIAGSFYSLFPATGELGLSLTSIEGGTPGDANAASILLADPHAPPDPFSILTATSASTSSSPTIRALTTGQLSTHDHKIIAEIGGTATDSLLLPFNADGSEPSELTKLKSLGWIKLDALRTAAGVKAATGGTYSLTPVGQAIYKRTVATTLGPHAQDGTGNASGANLSTIKAGLAAQVKTLLGTLSSVGVNIKV